MPPAVVIQSGLPGVAGLAQRAEVVEVVGVRVGFPCESAAFIGANVPTAVRVYKGAPDLNPILLDIPNTNVRKEGNEIRYNMPEAFAWPEIRF